MKHTSKYIFSLLLVVVSLTTNAQDANKKAPPPTAQNKAIPAKNDTLKPKKTERYGLRVGVDLNKLILSSYSKNYKGFELVGDFKFSRKYYAAVELGNENKTVDDTRLNYTTNGSFIKAGFDYNGYANWLGMNNMLYIGMRYGVSSFSQTLNSYKIYDTNHYFPDAAITYPDQKYNGLSAQWIEVVTGIKAEIVKNLYLGFSVRINALTRNNKPDNFDNLFIPGFNRTYTGTFGSGFNYTVSYFLPLYKSGEKLKEIKKEN